MDKLRSLKRNHSREDIEVRDDQFMEVGCPPPKRRKLMAEEHEINNDVQSCSQWPDGEISINSIGRVVPNHMFSFLCVKDRILDLFCNSWQDVGQNISWNWPKKLILGISNGSRQVGFAGDDVDTFDEMSCCPSKTQRLTTSSQENLEELLTVSSSYCQFYDVAPINCLPTEVLDHIFGFLGVRDRIRIELVCKRWQAIGQNVPWQWPKELVFKVGKRSMLRDLVSELFELVNDRLSPTLFARCRSLIKLTVDQTNCGSWCSSTVLYNAGQYCQNLTELTLMNVSLIDMTCLKALLQRCKKLKIINANFLPIFKLRTFSIMFEKDVLRIVKDCPALETLHISSRINFATGRCFDVMSRNLNVLWLANCRDLEAIALEHLMSRCEYIEDLRLSDCCRLNQPVLEQVLNHYKDTLKILHLDRWEQEVRWSQVIPVLKKLEDLSLCGCYEVDDDFCSNLARNCQKVKVLRVGDTDISDAGLLALSRLPSLTDLDIESLSLSGSGIIVLASKARLERLYASNVEDLSNADECFGELAQLCPNLKILDVSNVDTVSKKLVRIFCDALTSGVLKGGVKLGVKNTSVTEDAVAVTCDGLELVFSDIDSLYMASDLKEKKEEFYVVDPKYEYTIQAY